MRSRCCVILFLICRASDTISAAENQAVVERPANGDLSETVDQLEAAVREGISRGSAIGAQLVVAAADQPFQSHVFGVRAPGSAVVVDRETLFCIGSCSKPIVSACLMTLVDEGKLALDDPIDEWLDECDELHVQDEPASARAPTVRELLAHRGGIYSQRQKLTPVQRRAIRDFRLTLAESVEIIARQPLIATAGESFQYSGAGYCVLGRVAEEAGGLRVEELLQRRLGGPLHWSRTTWFPATEERNIAAGGLDIDGVVQIHPQSPHLLGDELRLPLVGGSIYSTAEETARFAMMMLNGGRSGEQQVLSENAYTELIRRQFADGNYGLGWSLQASDEGETIVLSHGGALCSYRSLLFVSLDEGFCVVVHWTLSDPASDDIGDELRNVLRKR